MKKIGKANHDAYNLKQKNLYIMCCKNLNILDTFMMHKLIIDCYQQYVMNLINYNYLLFEKIRKLTEHSI